MKGLPDLFGSSIFAALLSCAFRCALDSFNNHNRAKRDYKIVEKKIRNDFLLYLESNILVRIKKKHTCVTGARRRNVSREKMIPKLREERIAEYTYVYTKRTVTSIILSVAFRRHNK